MERFPVRNLDNSNPTEAVIHDHLVSLVTRMLGLHEQLAKAKVPQVRTALQAQVAATDGEIDRLVYELYGLSDDDIRIVEGTADAPAEAE